MIRATEVTAQQILVPVGSVVGAVLIAFLVAVVVGALVRSVAKRSVIANDLARRAKRPLRALLVVIAVWVALLISVPDATWDGSAWMSALEHVLLIALIGAATWLVGTLAFVVEDVALSRYRVDVKDNRHARRVRTQIQLLRRITVAVLVIVAVAAVLLTFPGVSAFGASLLASAGVLSIVAGLAAQSSLANVFAGLQLAFTDAIRVDDVVIVEEEWGRIEEITLTYVVVHVWDDRRLILPSTHFTQTPFENWTRRAAELLGTVEIDVDWQVPVDAMRAELNRLLAATDLWDHRVGILQVTDAVGGTVRLRALASAVDAPTLFDLRCYLREGLVSWLQSSAPQGLPRTRVETSEAPRAVLRPVPAPSLPDLVPTSTGAHAAVEADASTGAQDARLFTGSVEAIERSRSFTGPGQDVIDEREEHAADARGEETDPAPTPARTSGGRRVQVVTPTGAVLPAVQAPLSGATGAAEPAGAGAVVGATGDQVHGVEEAADDASPADDPSVPGSTSAAAPTPAAAPTSATARPSAAASSPAAGTSLAEPDEVPTGRRAVSSTGTGTDTVTGVTQAVPAAPLSAPPGPEPIPVPGRAEAAALPPVARPDGAGPALADTQRLVPGDLAPGGPADPARARPSEDPDTARPQVAEGAEPSDDSGTMVLPAVPGTADLPAAADDPATPPTRRSVRSDPRDDLDR
ncbi:MAG TPA: mechanosensitive ion channel domain-containing protein [Cellulomonas sp.]